MSPVVIIVGFACDLKQEEHYHPFTFCYVLGASCHHLKLMLHLNDMLVKACCWILAIHAWVSRERRSSLTHMEWDPKPEVNLWKKKKILFGDLCQFKEQGQAVHCSCSLKYDNETVVSVIHSREHKSNTNRSLVTRICGVWSQKLQC